jgi:aspartate aminotransferase
VTGDGTGPQVVLSRNVMGLGRSPTLAIQATSRRLADEGRQVFFFGLGQSPFPVPEPVVDALRANASRKDYLPVEGLPELRRSVCDYLRRRRNAIFAEANVVVGPGSKELLFLIQLAFGGTILLPTPCWVSYAPQAKLAGRPQVFVRTRAADGYTLDPRELDRVCRETAGPKLLVLTSPNNPTGTSYDERRLDEIAAVARLHRLLVVSDEIYAELSFSDDYVSIANKYPEGTILLTGLSKWCGAGGWRLGVAVFPQQARPLTVAVATAASETFTSTSAPIQHAAVRAFRGGAAIESYLVRARKILRALAFDVAATLRRAGLGVPQPSAAFYLFPDAEPLRPRLAERSIETSAQLCDAMLEETGVATLPGSDFGRAPEELTFRLSLVDFDGARALEAAAGVEGEVDAAFLSLHCPRVLAGAAAVAAWLKQRHDEASA